jgi:hypothetical protein
MLASVHDRTVQRVNGALVHMFGVDAQCGIVLVPLNVLSDPERM